MKRLSCVSAYTRHYHHFRIGRLRVTIVTKRQNKISKNNKSVKHFLYFMSYIILHYFN